MTRPDINTQSATQIADWYREQNVHGFSFGRGPVDATQPGHDETSPVGNDYVSWSHGPKTVSLDQRPTAPDGRLVWALARCHGCESAPRVDATWEELDVAIEWLLDPGQWLRPKEWERPPRQTADLDPGVTIDADVHQVAGLRIPVYGGPTYESLGPKTPIKPLGVELVIEFELPPFGEGLDARRLRLVAREDGAQLEEARRVDALGLPSWMPAKIKDAEWPAVAAAVARAAFRLGRVG